MDDRVRNHFLLCSLPFDTFIGNVVVNMNSVKTEATVRDYVRSAVGAFVFDALFGTSIGGPGDGAGIAPASWVPDDLIDQVRRRVPDAQTSMIGQNDIAVPLASTRAAVLATTDE